MSTHFLSEFGGSPRVRRHAISNIEFRSEIYKLRAPKAHYELSQNPRSLWLPK